MYISPINHSNINAINTNFTSKLPNHKVAKGWIELAEYCFKNGKKDEFLQQIEKLSKNGDDGILGLFHLYDGGSNHSWCFIRANSTNDMFWENMGEITSNEYCLKLATRPYIRLHREVNNYNDESCKMTYSQFDTRSYKDKEELPNNWYLAPLKVLEKINDKQSPEYEHMFLKDPEAILFKYMEK